MLLILSDLDRQKICPKMDLILDVVTYRSIFDYKRTLSPKGIYVMLGGGSWIFGKV